MDRKLVKGDAKQLAVVLYVMLTSHLIASTAVLADDEIKFGMDIRSIDDQAELGVKPDYGMIWVGPWTLKTSWNGVDNGLEDARSRGVTPVIQFYYWGDDISKDCIEKGCYSKMHKVQKSKKGWDLLAEQLANHINSEIAGEDVVIVLEPEFNKNGADSYEPLDDLLKEKADFFHREYKNSIIVLGFGNWNSGKWINFDKAAEASDMVGLQTMRGSTRNSEESYLRVADSLILGSQRMRNTFDKGIFVTDLALSSYPGKEYEKHQETALKEIFERKVELKSSKVQAIVYRSLKDTPTMNAENHYGEAEKYWGLQRSDGTPKPARKAWIDGVKAERTSLGNPEEEEDLKEEESNKEDVAEKPPMRFHLSERVNNWWAEIYVNAEDSIENVQISVDEKVYDLKKNSWYWYDKNEDTWESWSIKMNIKSDSEVRFNVITDGSRETSSDTYIWK